MSLFIGRCQLIERTWINYHTLFQREENIDLMQWKWLMNCPVFGPELLKCYRIREKLSEMNVTLDMQI